MRRATQYMVDHVATEGGYVWSYLPDRSRRWGEIEARPTMIWVQPPGTGTMGHLFLDAYHATGDEYYYRAAEGAANALIRGQHRSGGWNYFIDFAGPASTREWYRTIGRNAWRMEEFQHYADNATFDDAGTAEAMRLLLRLYVERRDPRYRAAARPGDLLRPQQPICQWRLAAALAARPRLSRLCALHHLQRRCRGGEYRLPADGLSVARRRARAAGDPPRRRRSSSPPSSRCRSPAGASSTAST